MPPPHDDLAARLQAGLPERYTLERELGRGGMAVVYLARERHPSRQVAIKVLDPVITVGIGRERFLREIDFVSNLTHPHIVPIFAAGTANGLLYFVMPHVSGESLAQRIRREGHLPVAAALRLAAEVAGALEYAHRRHIVHRDIKPENILLHDDFALVADFGVARAVRAARTDVITQDGFTLGTPGYMSPEQATGVAEVDPRSDIYSLACVFYQMVAGEPPFGEGPWDRVMRRQVNESSPPLAERVPGIPADLSALIDHALAKAPTDRLRSAAEFGAELERLRAVLTSGERPVLLPGSATMRGRLPWIAVAALTVLLVLAVLARRATEPIPALAATPAYAESLAVMPVANLTPDASLELVADAVTYEAIVSLHRVPSLKVSAYASVRRLAAEPIGPRDAVTQLGVRLVLSSQLRTIAGEVRLDAELVDGLTDRVVDRGSWIVGPAAVPGTETSLARRLVEMVARGTGLSPDAPEAARLEGPAYDAFRLGQHLLARRTPVGVRLAIEHFTEAIGIDSTYAPAYEGLASAYGLALFYRYDIGLGGYEAAALALAAANRAIALDPFGAAYGARGYIVSRAYGPTDRAARDFARQLELTPNAGQARAWSAAVLYWEGRTEEAMANAILGAELNPLVPSAQLSVALMALPLGQYDLAVRTARRATELEPELVESRAIEGRALLLAGRPDECLLTSFGPHAAIRAMCLRAVGRVPEAAAIVDSIARALENGTLADTPYTSVIQADGLASYYAWSGDRIAALRWLHFAFDQSPMGVDRRILESAIFRSLRSDPTAASQLRAMVGQIWDRVERLGPR
jgi:eukaryotic-like serine/threonine-protein kinase